MRHPERHAAPSLPAVAALIACALPTLAGASPAGAATARGTSSNWAGYAASGNGVRFRAVSGSWVQPAVTCETPSPSFAAMWVGLGGYHTTSRALEQIGTEADCRAGAARYGAWYELVPAGSIAIPMRVRPGDQMSASVRVAGRRVTLRLTNLTRGTTFARRLRPASRDVSSADWIMEAPALCGGSAGCVITPLANFGTASFTAARATNVAGHAGGIADGSWHATAIDLASSGFVADSQSPGTGGAATTGDLDPTGTTFSIAFQPVASPPPGSAWTAPPSNFGWGVAEPPAPARPAQPPEAVEGRLNRPYGG